MNKYLLPSLCLMALTSPAQADGSALTLPTGTISAAASEADDSIRLATPTSAGSRLGLSALETPASTDSLSGERIRARGDRSIQDAVSRSAGISRTGTPGDGGTSLSARGFTGQSSVMQLYDGNRMYTGMGTVTFPVDTWAVERVDVLRGPASVLYGEGATGAVINTVAKKPFSGEIENYLRLGYGSFDRQQQALDSGGSLSDTLSYRLNLNRERSNGWIDRGDSSGDFVSAALRWQARDDLAFTLAHDYGDQNPMNYFGTPLIDGRLHKSLRDKNYNVRNDKQHYNDQWTRLTSQWQISDNLSASNELYYLKAQRRWQNAENYNYDPANRQLTRSGNFGIGHQQEQVGDRQTFTFKHSLLGLDSQTLTGVDYNRIRFHMKSNSPFTDSFTHGQPVDLYHPAPGDFASDSPYRDQFKTTTRQMSVFAENRLQLSERWSLVSGVRRDYVHIDRDDLKDDSRSDKTLTGNNWKAGLVFAVTPDTSLYGQYSTSTDGVGGLISLSKSQQQFDLSSARQTEIGLKQMFWDQRGEWTLAAYHIVKKKLLTDVPGDPDLKQQVGQQSSNGLEASLDLQLPRAWQLQANAAIVRARYDDFQQDVDGVQVSRDGKRPVDVPRRTANLWLSKALDDDLRAGAGVRYVDARYADMANRNQLPGYTVVDAALSWKALPSTTLGLQLNNLFDRQYAQSQYNDGQQWILGEPRSFFVTADYTF
ncbi:TonB-dependent receptor [Pseudomonas protegens]|uniref:TonB-dependent outermembrane receptor n=2 Tax=Pseudomonas protegens TaxID=380021 RepID=Q4KIZ5_PSEF5|nr:TonB-dependent receptor [Pseudomonas protegens]AAY96053.1 TonB-dependent outermembrane receptor [Pseudomonas protegens Pf-5]ASE19818.1 TonB-dependent siderophore receptor [Pseudomonas protegens]QEZ50616.1 TonB-dependent receptor [Pseudomonas protegens]QEZ57287.1 TonB-dependent receptor [Pseudomonas protegens]QEZ61896.1 TonB-dependent receptor [Pseudomonas protegens]